MNEVEKVLDSAYELTGERHEDWQDGVHVTHDILADDDLVALLFNQSAIPLFWNNEMFQRLGSLSQVPRRICLVHIQNWAQDSLDALRECQFLEFHSSLSNDVLSALGGSSHLRTLLLQHSTTGVKDSWFRSISEIDGLKALRVGSNRSTDYGVALLGRLHELQHLCLFARNSTDEGLRFLSQLQDLRKLDLHACIEGMCLEDVVPNLTHFSLSPYRSDELDSVRLQSLLGAADNLNALRLNGSLVQNAVDANVMDTIGHIANLTDLELDSPVIPRGWLELIATQDKLTRLSIGGSDIRDSELISLENASQLADLDIAYCRKLRGDAFEHLPKALERLNVSETPVTRRAIGKLEQLENLRFLCVGDDEDSGTFAEDEWMESIARIPRLVGLRITLADKDRCKVTRRAIEILAMSTSLKYVQVDGWGGDGVSCEWFVMNDGQEGVCPHIESRSWRFDFNGAK